MSAEGRNPKYNWVNFDPQSADPSSPNEGDIFFSDGTSRDEGPWYYSNGTWVQISATVAPPELQSESFTITTPSFNVRVATTVNGTLATAFDNGSTVDGVVLATNDIILLKNQTTTTDNGVYIVQASGVPVRHTDYDTFTELNYAGVHVTAGTANTNTNWFQNNILTSLSDAQSWSTSMTTSWTVPDGVTEIFVEGCGGGGGGGGGGETGGGGGGGGGAGAIVKLSQTVTSLDLLNITIGAGGTGGARASGANTPGSPGVAGANTTITGTGVSLTFYGGGYGGGGGHGAGAGTSGGDTEFASGGTTTGNNGGGGGGASKGNGGDGNTPTNSYLKMFLGAGGGGGSGATANRTGNRGTVQDIGLASPSTGASGATNSGGGGGGGGAYDSGGNGGGGSQTGTAVAGGSATANSGAGGGGGGGTSTGTAAAGGNGGSGRVKILWVAAP